MEKRRERLLTLETERLDRQLMRYETDGFGLWDVILKETGELIGQCGLTMPQSRCRAKRNDRLRQYIKHYYGMDMPHLLYQISRVEYEAALAREAGQEPAD